MALLGAPPREVRDKTQYRGGGGHLVPVFGGMLRWRRCLRVSVNDEEWYVRTAAAPVLVACSSFKAFSSFKAVCVSGASAVVTEPAAKAAAAAATVPLRIRT